MPTLGQNKTVMLKYTSLNIHKFKGYSKKAMANESIISLKQGNEHLMSSKIEVFLFFTYYAYENMKWICCINILRERYVRIVIYNEVQQISYYSNLVSIT